MGDKLSGWTRDTATEGPLNAPRYSPADGRTLSPEKQSLMAHSIFLGMTEPWAQSSASGLLLGQGCDHPWEDPPQIRKPAGSSFLPSPWSIEAVTGSRA